jgi:cytochrome c2
MFSRFRIALGLALTLALILILPVFAGGWAVITVDELPTGVVAGKPTTIGFTVLQHGKTPLSGIDPTITATLSKSESFVVHAEEEGKPGHYIATLTFPTEGAWEWSIQAFTMDQPMPVLNVTAGTVSSVPEPVATAESAAPSLSWLWIVRMLALAVGVIGLAVALIRKALALTGLCLVVGLGSFVTGSTVPEAEAQSKSSVETISDSSTSQMELGRQLFVAKGCITCHVNRKITNSSDYWTIDMGAPDLSMYASDPEILHKRLKDPSTVKADTKMPNLGLKEVEIEALIAFINSK